MLERAWDQTGLVLLLVIALAFALRLVLLAGPSLRGDEALSVIYAQRSLPEIVHITRFVSGHPPLFYSLLHVWVRLAGTTEFAARFFAVWWGVLLLPLVYLVGLRLFDHWTGFWAALILAVNSFQVWHGQDIRSYTMLATLALLSCWLFWRAMRRPGWRNWARLCPGRYGRRAQPLLWRLSDPGPRCLLGVCPLARGALAAARAVVGGCALVGGHRRFFAALALVGAHGGHGRARSRRARALFVGRVPPIPGDVWHRILARAVGRESVAGGAVFAPGLGGCGRRSVARLARRVMWRRGSWSHWFACWC